ncbi:MAG: MltA domain-containing protein [Bdellovibrionota bacterium]
MRNFLLIFFLITAAPAFADDDPVACNSDQYRSFLGDLGNELFKAAVNHCLDGIRAENAKKVDAAASKAPADALTPYTFHQVAPSDLPGTCVDGSLAGMEQALRAQLASCGSFNAAKLAETRRFGCRNYSRQEWCNNTNARMLELVLGSTTFQEYSNKVKAEFDWLQSDGWPDDSSACQGKTQFTAYHGPPPIEASAVPTSEFGYPVYATPKDLLTGDDCGGKMKVCRKAADGSIEPYPDRNAIDNEGALKGQGAEIAWVKDPVDVAFLMVEGSGSMNLHKPDGTIENGARLNYDGSNGRISNMLGRILLCMGATRDEYGSMTGIKNYLAAHPDRLKTILAFDKSYVFFRSDGKPATGADDIPVTPRHSFATDRRLIPTGTVMMFNTKRTDKKTENGCSDVTSLAISQDSGGAINGPHSDWYLGEGADAQAQADDVNQCGSLFVALPKNAGTPIPGCGGDPVAQTGTRAPPGRLAK